MEDYKTVKPKEWSRSCMRGDHSYRAFTGKMLMIWIGGRCKVFRYSFSETIPIFFYRLKRDFILVRSL